MAAIRATLACAALGTALTTGGGLLCAGAHHQDRRLHSPSGTIAISETTLKDTILMLVDDQNRKGGLLGPLAGTSTWWSPAISASSRKGAPSRPVRSRR